MFSFGLVISRRYNFFQIKFKDVPEDGGRGFFNLNNDVNQNVK